MATEIRELREGKGIAASTLKSFYERKTNPRKSTLKAIEEWIDKNKEMKDKDVNNNEMQYRFRQSDQRIGYTH